MPETVLRSRRRKCKCKCVSTNAMRVDFQAGFQQYSDKKMTAIQQTSSLECCKRVQQRPRWVQPVLLILLGFADGKIM